LARVGAVVAFAALVVPLGEGGEEVELGCIQALA
jgi:hypothetical protein